MECNLHRHLYKTFPITDTNRIEFSIKKNTVIDFVTSSVASQAISESASTVSYLSKSVFVCTFQMGK